MAVDDTMVDAVAELIGKALGIEDRAVHFDAGTHLFGDLPELDSLGVVELAVALETRFGIVISDEEFTADVFETVGSLAGFVTAKQRSV